MEDERDRGLVSFLAGEIFDRWTVPASSPFKGKADQALADAQARVPCRPDLWKPDNKMRLTPPSEILNRSRGVAGLIADQRYFPSEGRLTPPRGMTNAEYGQLSNTAKRLSEALRMATDAHYGALAPGRLRDWKKVMDVMQNISAARGIRPENGWDRVLFDRAVRYYSDQITRNNVADLLSVLPLRKMPQNKPPPLGNIWVGFSPPEPFPPRTK